jgi:5-methylcytosine-specific restriction endonuclease McrA
VQYAKRLSSLEIEHIIEWANVLEHEFNNMIVLCATCHGRKRNTSDPGHINRASLPADQKELNDVKWTLFRQVADG